MESFFEKDLTNDVQMYIMYIDNKDNKGDKMEKNRYKIKDQGKEIIIETQHSIDGLKKAIDRVNKSWKRQEKEAGYEFYKLTARNYAEWNVFIVVEPEEIIDTDIEI